MPEPFAPKPNKNPTVPRSSAGASASESGGAVESGAVYHDDTSWNELYEKWRQTGDPRARERLILMHRKLVVHLARRFVDRGELFEDILQHGLIGLIQALDNFDPNRGVRFSTFATPSIIGEIRRFFRDRARGMKVPRRLQDLNRGIAGQIEGLTQKLNRSPTYNEIAIHLGVTEEEVIEALEIGRAVEPMSLDDSTSQGDDSPMALADKLGELDPDIISYEDNEALREALERLPAAQQQALFYAYFQGYSQAEIARRLNVSQMHISRLLRRALGELRKILNE